MVLPRVGRDGGWGGGHPNTITAPDWPLLVSLHEYHFENFGLYLCFNFSYLVTLEVFCSSNFQMFNNLQEGYWPDLSGLLHNKSSKIPYTSSSCRKTFFFQNLQFILTWHNKEKDQPLWKLDSYYTMTLFVWHLWTWFAFLLYHSSP